jgi:L-alanine-DL-glutamate epimerase-like enolase superfamily enzyme
VQLKLRRFDLTLAHAWAIAGGAQKSVQPVIFVELKAAGAAGIGESAPSRRYHETVDTAWEFLERVDARRLSFGDIPGSMDYLEALAPGEFSAKSALNVALLDGAAKIARQPLHTFLGLGFRENHHVTSFSIGIDHSPVIRKKVLAAAEFPILKMKLGSVHDRENLAALRTAAPAKRLRVDANEAWKTKEEALKNIEWLAADGHIEFVEQPMPASASTADLRWLKARSPLPLFADESFHSAAEAERCGEGFHGVNVKLHKTGGVITAVKAMRTARQLGLKTMLGCMIESSVLISAAAHLADLADYLDLDGNLLVTNDPFRGVAADRGVLTFAGAPEGFGLRVVAR